MSEFEKWFKSLNENGRVTYFLGQESKIAEEAWFASACTSIDHIHRLQHEKANQKAEIEQLKAEKAGLERSVKQILSDSKESMVGYVEMDLYDKGYRVCTEYLIDELEKALRGTND